MADGSKPAPTLTAAFVADVTTAIDDGGAVRRALPMSGRLYIDRKVPFLCVYRRPVDSADEGTERLVTGSAAYLIGSHAPQTRKAQAKLVRAIVETLQERFGAFLLIEVSASRDEPPPGDLPVARVVGAQGERSEQLVEVLAAALRTDRRLAKSWSVEPAPAEKRPGFVLTASEARSLQCTRLALVVPPLYRDPVTGALFPIVLRTMRRVVEVALRKAAFAFAKSRTTRKPRDYRVLGRRAIAKDVLTADGQLARLAGSYDFLLSLSPINFDHAWRDFKRSRFEKRPELRYPPLTVDVSQAKRQLFSVPVERVEDPTMADLLREKQFELDRQLTMLAERGSRRVLYGSLQLYGTVSDSLLRRAERLIELIPPSARESGDARPISPQEFAAIAREEIARYSEHVDVSEVGVELRTGLAAGLMVSRGRLLIETRSKLPRSRVAALLQHEVGTHVLTYLNGKAQRLQLLSLGLANYDETQEGLAVLAEYLVGGLSRPRLRLLAGRVVAARALVDGSTFIETFRLLLRYGFSQQTAFSVAVRTHRGGGLTKDAVYLRGFVGLLSYLADGGSFETLLVGKIARSHVTLLRELRVRQVLIDAPLRPTYLDDPAAQQRLASLAEGKEPYQLIE